MAPPAEDRIVLARSFGLPVPADHAFAVLTDPSQMIEVVPGATLRSWDGARFEAAVRLRVGPMPLVGQGAGRLVVRDHRARRTVVEVTRLDGRPVGTVTFVVAEDGADRSLVAVHADLLAPRAGGRLGRSLVTDVGHRMFHHASTGLAAKLGGLPMPAAPKAAEHMHDGSPVPRHPRLVLPAVAEAAAVTAGVTLAVVRRLLGNGPHR